MDSEAARISLKALRLAFDNLKASRAERVAFKPLGTLLDGSKMVWHASAMALEPLRTAATAERMVLSAERLAFKPSATALIG